MIQPNQYALGLMRDLISKNQGEKDTNCQLLASAHKCTYRCPALPTTQRELNKEKLIKSKTALLSWERQFLIRIPDNTPLRTSQKILTSQGQAGLSTITESTQGHTSPFSPQRFVLTTRIFIPGPMEITGGKNQTKPFPDGGLAGWLAGRTRSGSRQPTCRKMAKHLESPLSTAPANQLMSSLWLIHVCLLGSGISPILTLNLHNKTAQKTAAGSTQLQSLTCYKWSLLTCD